MSVSTLAFILNSKIKKKLIKAANDSDNDNIKCQTNFRGASTSQSESLPWTGQ